MISNQWSFRENIPAANNSTFASFVHEDLGIEEDICILDGKDVWSYISPVQRPDLKRLERIGRIGYENHSIESIVARHFRELNEASTILQQKSELLATFDQEVWLDSLANILQGVRTNHMQIKHAPKKIGDYVDVIHKYSAMIEGSLQHLGTNQVVRKSDLKEVFWQTATPNQEKVIIDQDIPPSALILGILLRSRTCKDPLALPSAITTLYRHLQRVRRQHFEMVFVRRDIHYSFYYYNSLVVETKNQQLTIHQPDLFQKCFFEVPCLESEIITNKMLNEAIEFGIIPDCNRALLTSFLELQTEERDLEDLMLNGLDPGPIKLTRTTPNPFSHLKSPAPLGDHTVKRKISLPHPYGNLARAREITVEIGQSGLEVELRESLESLFVFKENHQVTINPITWPIYKGKKHLSLLMPIFDYLRGKKAIEAITIDEGNVEEVLKITKLINWTLRKMNCISLRAHAFDSQADLNLRWHILQQMPSKKTHQVFLNTFNEVKMREAQYWIDPRNWITERAAQRGLTAVVLHIAAITLGRSNNLRDCVGVRGNTGTSKSTSIRKILAGDDKGVMNPDQFKKMLKTKPGPFKEALVLNSQVHFEGAYLFDDVHQEIKQEKLLPFVLDMRLLTVKVIQEELIQPAKTKNLPVILHDLQSSSVACSLVRVLTRATLGPDACPHFDPIIDGFKQSILNRKDVLDLVKKEDLIKEYKLILDDKLICEKKDGIFSFYDHQSLVFCTELPKDIDTQLSHELERLITEDFITDAVEKSYIFPEQKKLLTPWIGITLGEAVKRHSEREKK